MSSSSSSSHFSSSYDKDYGTTAAAADDDDADAVFLIEIKIDQGVIDVGVVFATAAEVTKIDSMTLIGDDDD